MPACRQCQQNFTVTDADRAFYAKMDVPAPTLCPLCRQQRRLAWRNERTFYQTKSDLSGKDMLSIYHPSRTFPVYDQEEWWSDTWDPLSYGREIDWNRSLMEQIHELQLTVPRPALFNRNSVNSHYGNLQEGDLNCFYEVGSGWCEESYYGTINIRSKNIVDCHYSQQCELSYELVNCEQCYQSVSCQNCQNCLETYFCYNCRGCQNCFGCVNLRNAQYQWFNQPIAPEEFTKRIAALGSFSQWQTWQQEFARTKQNSPHAWSVQVKCERSTGDYLTYCQGVESCFDLVEATECKYCYRGEKITDSYDCDIGGWPASWLYEVLSSDTSNHAMFNVFCWENSFVQYSYHCFTSHDLFGCVGLRGQHHCILNRQYSEAEYQALLPKLIAKMRADGEYGEFFPAAWSPFCYNESTAHEYYPLTQEKVLQWGWRWQDQLPNTTGRETIAMAQLTDRIQDVSDAITSDILACGACGRNYKIIPQELAFYHQLNIPLPRHCPTCRHLERIALRNPRRLWHRQCMNAGCQNTFETTYSPDRPEKVYCETCYQKEVY